MQNYPKLKGSMPRESGPKILVHRVLSSTPEDFVILSHAGVGVDFHYYAERSSECFAPDGQGDCDRCRRNWPLKWRAYLHCIMVQGMEYQEVFLELTANAFKSLEFQTSERKSLRGVPIKVCKTAGGKKGRYIVSVASVHQDKKIDIPEVDPIPTLRLLWEAPGRKGNRAG